MPTVLDCVSQTDRGILSPLLKSYKAILDYSDGTLTPELMASVSFGFVSLY
jgi:hypothetical protein